MVVGVTGGYCAGKDAAVKLLAAYDIAEINEDKIGHEVLAAQSAQVVEAFGGGVLNDEGRIDRKALGSIVFSNPSALGKLESIVHPRMVEETRKRITGSDTSHVMINAALLHRMRLHLLCDLVLLIEAPLITRLYRAKKRDRYPTREILKRIRSQREFRKPDIRKQFLNEKGMRVDTVIVRNCASVNVLSKRLAHILSEHGMIGR